MPSAQTLDEEDRRILAGWAADCAERVLHLFEADVPDDRRPRDGIDRARAFAAGEVDAAGQIRVRFVAGRAAGGAGSPAGRAAARAAGQASGVAHMGAHALGAAAYAARAVDLAPGGGEGDGDDELAWQLDSMSDPVRAALRRLPPLGQDRSGPLGPGLLASGALGAHIRRLQDALGHGGPPAAR
ncbi:hypothetical protein I8920_09315 [Curtobacterium sp. YC1]|uniref:putative immunity protein n=1 Tax=Curtobacterium sp. YC1 TaxID=2795488 RepID=UPI0018E58130|nr:hypothetical protein [Curtobacterium sp. YC1]QQD75070.1 hypothetical protein I8920_09315 [Curtobacterium sp. YC1]